MTRALVWKEVREQWVIWLVLLLVAAGATAGLRELLTPGSARDETLTAVLWLTAWGYGLVCGALLLAARPRGRRNPSSTPSRRRGGGCGGSRR